MKKDRADRLRKLILQEPETYFWPAVVNVMLDLGWRPPPLTDEALDHVLDDMGGLGHKRIPANAKLELSPMETEVLRLAAKGYSKPEVATILGIGFETVKTRQSHILSKLGAHNITQAVAIAIREGIIE